MNRLDRRMIVVAGRRRVPLAPWELAIERRVRGAAARRARAMLRQGRMVLMRHPRWADVPGFLHDLAEDLAVDAPEILSTRLDLSNLVTQGGQVGPEGWARLLSRLSEAAGVPLPTAAAWPMAREGFRFGLHAVLEGSREMPRRALLAHGAHHLPVDVLQDLAHTWAKWSRPGAEPPSLRLLLAVRGANVDAIEDAHLLTLPDWEVNELTSYLTGWLGLVPDVARKLAIATGGLPEVVRRVILRGRVQGRDPDVVVLEALGSLRGQVEETLRVCRAEDQLAARLDALCEESLPYEPGVDDSLVSTGVVRVVGRRPELWAELRSPVVRRLDLGLSGEDGGG
jgi:hypothetical protein